MYRKNAFWNELWIVFIQEIEDVRVKWKFLFRIYKL